MKIEATLPVNMMLLDKQTLRKQLRTNLFGEEKLIGVSIAVRFIFTSTAIAAAQNAEIIGDDKGTKGQTELSIEVDLTEEDEKRIYKDHTLRDELFVEIVNDLIDVYRLKGNREWVERITLDHVPIFNTSFKHTKMQILAANPRIVSLHPKERQEFLEKLKKSYEESQALPVFIEYWLLAKKYINSARYDLGIIFVNITLESFIFLLLRLVHGDEEFKKLTSGVLCDTCGQMQFIPLCELVSGINKKVGVDDKKAQELIRLARKPNKSNLRNDITHGKVLFIDRSHQHKDDVHLAFKSMDEFCGLYIRALPDLQRYL